MNPPPKSILNPLFRYTRSEHTNIRKLFARVRKELKQQQQPTKSKGTE